MPPLSGSRYAGSLGLRDEQGRLFLTDREPFRYRELPDTRVHIVVEGDTLWHLAGEYFAPLPRACGYWWLIGEFQPEPIHDPTIPLRVGAQVYIPSLRVLETDVLGEGFGEGAL